MKGLTLRPREQTRIDVLSKVLRREASAAEAAEALSLSQRQVWRLLAALRAAGIAGLVHGNRGRRPVNALPAEIRDRIVALAGERYADANYTHLTELLAEREEVRVSRSTVRNVLIAGGLWRARRHRPRCRLRRERLPQEGMLLQIDGSQHHWLGNEQPPFCLFLAVDDATGAIPHALFRRQEDLVGYLQLLDHILRTRGIPSAVYSDRSTIFWPLGGPRGETEFGRALRELGIGHVIARSPQAKGRVERIGGVLQDRLAVELRLAGAKNLADANRVLLEYLPRHNRRFAVEPRATGTAYRPVPAKLDLEGILSVRHFRVVGRDHTIRFRCQLLQLDPRSLGQSVASAKVEVQERLDGAIVVARHGRVIEATCHPGRSSAGLAARLKGMTTMVQRQEASAAECAPDPDRRDVPRGLRRQQEWWLAIQAAHANGLSLRAIARELSMSRNTVRKYIRRLDPPVTLEPKTPD
jgi:transposase